MANPDDRRYTKDHEWIRIADNTAEVGITDYAQKSLGDVVFVELPKVGDSFEAGAPFGSIESVKAVSELFAPVSGQVIEVNPSLQNSPEQVNTNPYETWLIKIRVSDPGQAQSLLDSAQYDAAIAQEG